jgi:hypothetical protein
MHSVKNRFLMRIKNMTGGIYRRCWLRLTARDAVVLAACLICEQSSLPAFWHLAKSFRHALHRRAQIMKRRRVGDEVLAQWFDGQSSSQPVGVESRMAIPLPARE